VKLETDALTTEDFAHADTPLSRKQIREYFAGRHEFILMWLCPLESWIKDGIVTTKRRRVTLSFASRTDKELIERGGDRRGFVLAHEKMKIGVPGVRKVESHYIRIAAI
jgi:hypothetical protein